MIKGRLVRKLEIAIDFIILQYILWKVVGESWSIASTDVRGNFLACA